MRSFALLLIALVATAGCGQMMSKDNAPQVVNAQNAEKLYAREWDLKGLTVDGRQVVMDLEAHITLIFAANGQVAGFAAVNRFNGTYSFTTDGKLAWGKPGFAVTRKMGPPELMEKEQAFLAGLPKTNVAILAKHTLVLQSDDSATVLSFDETGF
ncbi:MAG: hypothetical protein C5B46_05255 [Proteobacteria bacterium]|nr:MAG: hypothetical protein C5B46_05255 [Pseudomonadota bacterium]